MAQVSLHHVSKRYGAVVTVDDLLIDIAQGELVAFVGPSGCGKTTTLRMIAGLTDVCAGRVVFDGRDVTHLPSYRRNAGLVFQGYALFPHLTVAENVAFGLDMRGIRGAEADALVRKTLALVRLEHYAQRLPRELSGGQQQRVALARAIVIEPDVLLLDEPLSALDAKLRQDVRIEIRRLQKSLGLTCVFVTHDQEEAVSMADRIVVMNAGRVEQIGTPRTIYETPANRFVAEFIGMSNFLSGQVEAPGLFRTAGGSLLRYARRCHDAPCEWLAVRPEKVEVIPGAGGGPNQLDGVVDGVTYLGPLTELSIRLKSGETIVAHLQNRAGAAGDHLKAGEAAVVTWPAEASFLV